VKRIVFIASVIALLLIANGLLRSIFDLLHKEDILTQAQKQLEVEKIKNQKLKAELSYVQTDQFIEEEAHNKLFLVKPGEQEVLLPSRSAQNTTQNPKQQISNWKKWLQLFF